MAKRAKNENEELKELRSLIEKKLRWGASGSWTHYQFEELQEIIQQDTGISLSPNTLKRFFDKIKSETSASKTTKNTLAQFVGFKSYTDFLQKHGKRSNLKFDIHGSDNKRQIRIFTISLYVVLLLVVLFFVIKNKDFGKSKELDFKNASFSQVYESGTVPFTQIFKYQVDPEITDTIFFNELFKGNIALSTHDSVFSWIHFVPGFRQVRFLKNESILWESNYMVETDGWLCIFPFGGWRPRKYISLNDSRNVLTVTDEMLEENKIDLEDDGDYIHYFNAQNYDVPGSNFILETSIQNQLKTGFQQCQDAIITIECETFNFKIHFTQLGCQKFAELSLGEEYFNGTQNDLTRLTFDMNDWQKIKIMSENQTLSIFSNGDLLITKKYSGNPGNISMLHYSFRGNGMVDDILLKHGDGTIAYSENFD